MNSVDDTSARLGTNDAASAVQSEETPTLLAFILDTNPGAWTELESQQQISFKEAVECMLVYINAHLSFNNLNSVTVIAAHTTGAEYLYPKIERNENDAVEGALPSHVANGATMYRQFREVSNTILQQLDKLLSHPEIKSNGLSSSQHNQNTTYNESSSAVSGALSLALSYINKSQEKRPSARFGARILLLNTSKDISSQYIPTMNCIFAAQKMKVPIDVCKLGGDTVFLQQAADSTNGTYIRIADNSGDDDKSSQSHPKGLMQYLLSAFMVEPCMRSHVVLATQTDIDFKAACFVTKSVLDVGYVCSVCLCIMKDIPARGECPMCQTVYEEHRLTALSKVPVVVVRKKAKKKKVDQPS